MEMDRGISRRRMLAMSAAAGGVALGGDVGRAFAQTDKRIEQLAPELDKIIATSEPIKELATGFGGPLGPAEGPLWWKEGGFLLFTDIHNSRRMKLVAGCPCTMRPSFLPWGSRIQIPPAPPQYTLPATSTFMPSGTPGSLPRRSANTRSLCFASVPLGRTSKARIWPRRVSLT